MKLERKLNLSIQNELILDLTFETFSIWKKGEISLEILKLLLYTPSIHVRNCFDSLQDVDLSDASLRTGTSFADAVRSSNTLKNKDGRGRGESALPLLSRRNYNSTFLFIAILETSCGTSYLAKRPIRGDSERGCPARLCIRFCAGGGWRLHSRGNPSDLTAVVSPRNSPYQKA